MNKLLKLGIGLAVLGLIIGSHLITANAQTGGTLDAWKYSTATLLVPRVSSTTVKITSNNLTDNSGNKYSTSTAGGATTTINGMDGPTFTFSKSGLLTVATSAGPTITFGFASSSLGLGTASVYAYTDFLVSSTAYVANNSGNWAGTWQLYAPTDFLSSSTVYVATNTGNWAGTVQNKTLGTISTFGSGDYLTSSTVYLATSTGLTVANFASPNLSLWTNNLGWITTSTGLVVGNFASANISQWTNDVGYTTSTGAGDMLKSDNLAGLASTSTSRTNLGLGSAAVQADTYWLKVSNNGSDINATSTFRTNLGLGDAALYASSTWLKVANNFSDLNNTSTARTNLGLGSLAVVNSPVPIANGGRATTSVPAANSIMWFNGTSITGTSTVFLATSTGLTVSNFASANVSQWTNNANYIDLLDLSGTSPITYNTSTGAIACATCLTSAVTSANSITGAVNWLASGPGLSVASSSQNITYTFASSSLNLGTASVQNVGTFFQAANNLSESTNTSTLRTNIGYSAGTGITLSGAGAIANSGVLSANSVTGTVNLLADGTGLTVASSGQNITYTWTNPGYITTSTGLGVANFTTSSISQWTNDAGYVTSTAAGLSGNGTSTYIARYNTTTGLISDSGFTRTLGAGGADCTGGTITYSGGNTIHTFNTSSSLVCTSTKTASVLVVAGGGGGGNGASGGGGGGGVVSSTSFSASSTMTVTVGTGGAGRTVDSGDGTPGGNGNNSVFASLTATGGGGGGSYSGAATTGEGQNGGSGGGGGSAEASNINAKGSASPAGQGYDGGSGYYTYAGGGGGGAGSAGGNGAASNVAGNGGNGIASSISGASVTYGGGGGGGSNAGNPGEGGTGGGGDGKSGNNEVGGSGTDGLGGGGGGGGVSGGDGGNGGRGVVIVSYPTSGNSTYTDALTVGTSGNPTNGSAALFKQAASSTVYIGGASSAGCLVLGDSANGASPVYITATGSTISATTTKPSACR